MSSFFQINNFFPIPHNTQVSQKAPEMKLFTILMTISLCMGIHSCFLFNFTLNPLGNDESIVLREIISKYIEKYFSDNHLVSLIIFPSKTDLNLNIFKNLFNIEASIEFNHSIPDKLDSTMRDNRNPLNLIVVDHCKQLK